MRTVQRSRAIALALLLALCATFLPPGAGGTLPAYAAGTVSLTTLGSAYTEDFNTLANSGSANTAVPTGWEFSESGTNANTTYRAGTGSDNTGDTYSFGAAGSSERAFGGLRSGSLVPLIGAQFTNNTGGDITSLTIAYTGEQWRLGQNTSGRPADRLDFQLSTNATSIVTGNWTDYDALDFASPAVAGTVGALNGNVSPNRTALTFTITGLTIPNGASFWLRWADTDLIPGADDGLSVDDFSLTAGGATPPPVDPTTPAVQDTTPVNGATGVAANTNLTVTFNEPVNLAAGAFALSCNSLAQNFAVAGGPTTFTLDPAADLPGGAACTFTVSAAAVTDQDAIDPPDNMLADYVLSFSVAAPVDPCAAPTTPIYTIQGSGATVAVPGPVTTKGVVVGDYEGPSPALRGFFIQDPTGDGNPATSDGIFVFNGGNTDNVSLGDLVLVSGTAAENQGQSQISVSAANIVKCGAGTVAPVDVTLPFATLEAAEQYEGMLVRLPQTLYVTEHFQLGRFGQVVLSSGGRLPQPTNILPPGAPALAQQAVNNLNRIILDDGSQVQNPDPIVFARGGQPLSAANTLRGGDTATNIVGVMTFTWGGNAASPNAYRVRPVGALGGVVNFEPTNPRPAAAPAPAGSVRVAGMNLLNFFNTFDGLPDNVDNCRLGVGGAATDCRGADTQFEFDRQYAKTVAAIVGSGADIIGVNEIENDGYGPDSALQYLVDRLNTATAPGTYAFIDADAGTGQLNALGTDAIKVGMIYKPAKVTPVGQTAALNTVAFVNGGDSAPRSRPALAQAFQVNATGARFTAVANHLKSKGSACNTLDQNDGQGNCSIVRTNSAIELANWLATNPTGTGDPDVLIVGDLNSYAKEDPITALINRGYTNLIETFLGAGAYSYVFDGQWGYLDHALANAAMLPQVAAVAEWHINADEPSVLDYNTDFKTANLIASLFAPNEFRIADHDPVLVDLNPLNNPPSADAGGPYSADEGQSITLSATGADPDGTAVSFAWDLDNNGSFETPGQSVTYNAVDGSFSYTVKVQVTDATGAASVAAAVVNVANLPPTTGPITGPTAPVAVNTPVAVSAPYADPGILDTHTATWDWGDGTTSAGVVAGSNGSGTVSGSRSYTTPGVYTVKLTVTDKDGGSAQATYEFIVVYDPAGGFVTGGGWINSPAGAYPTDPSLAGKATFGFVAKYQKGANVPTGNTQFQFQAAGLNFQSTSYEWLVIAGAKAQYKGSGTINGGGSYGFMLTAIDGDRNGTSDRLRLKIWDKATSAVVYDNQVGAADGADPSTVLGGGSIVIHAGKVGKSDASEDGAGEEPAITNRLFLPGVMR
jgi:predicted extracellular nuclease